MAKFVYIDETGSVGTGGARQPLLTLVAVILHESHVQPLAAAVKELAVEHVGPINSLVEFHGYEMWSGSGCWAGKESEQLLSAYEAVIGLLDDFDVDVAHASINKQGLHDRYSGVMDGNAYLLGLQFLLEKVDRLGSENKLVIADESKEQQMRAVSMVAELQQWGLGEVPGTPLRTVIDSIHFVRSHASPGVQLADAVAYLLQRSRRGPESHPTAEESRQRMLGVIDAHTRTYRAAWPPLPGR